MQNAVAVVAALAAEAGAMAVVEGLAMTKAVAVAVVVVTGFAQVGLGQGLARGGGRPPAPLPSPRQHLGGDHVLAGSLTSRVSIVVQYVWALLLCSCASLTISFVLNFAHVCDCKILSGIFVL